MPHTTVIQAPPKLPVKKPRTKAERALAELGVEEMDDGVPQYERHTGAANVRHYPPGQFSPAALDALGEDMTPREFMRRRHQVRRVWEPVPVLPLVIDFTDVKEPLYPHRRPPQDSGSAHPDAAMYTDARKSARKLFPGDRRDPAVQLQRDLYYWDRIDAGTLPEDFNPYRPGTDRHIAFAERVSLRDDRPTNEDQTLLMTQRQVRRRAERKLKKGLHLTDEEMEILFKPLSEWDLEELKRGRPRSMDGKFHGPTPQGFLRGEVKEKIRDELQRRVRGKLDDLAVDATTTLHDILSNGEIDGRGRPIVPASVKMRAAEYVVDRMLGKPTQRVENDLSAKLAGLLGEVMVAPEVTLTAGGVVPTGALHAGQRGQRQGYSDEALEAVYSSTLGARLAIDNVMDAEVVEDDD